MIAVNLYLFILFAEPINEFITISLQWILISKIPVSTHVRD